MTEPIRVQLSRQKGWKMPPNTIKVDRSGKGVFGNPWIVGNPAQVDLGWMVGHMAKPLDAEWAVGAFRWWLADGYLGTSMLPAALNSLGRINARSHLRDRREAILRALPQLRGHNLACWCKIGAPCHADVLLEMLNGQ